MAPEGTAAQRAGEQHLDQLGIDFAPGQSEAAAADLTGIRRGSDLPGPSVDFSHGDVDAFPPPPGAFEAFTAGVAEGGAQAYTEYRGRASIREEVAERLAAFTGAPVDPNRELILTPGSQGALFLAMAACVSSGDEVAIVEPDYFANRKLVHFLGGTPRPATLHYSRSGPAEFDLDALAAAFRDGARTLVLSNPNNPTGVVYTAAQIASIAELANRFDATVIVDQLYSRLQYPGTEYTHLRAAGIAADNVVTLTGPSKTESLSGYRLGIAVGAPEVITRMEQLQAIVSLRAPGYGQAVLRSWFDEPQGWLQERIDAHQRIRDELVALLRAADGFAVRVPEAGSYVFPRLPELAVPVLDLVRLLRVQAQVTVTPGTEFGPHHGHSVRLNFSQDHARTVAAVQRMVELTQRYRA